MQAQVCCLFFGTKEGKNKILTKKTIIIHTQKQKNMSTLCTRIECKDSQGTQRKGVGLLCGMSY